MGMQCLVDSTECQTVLISVKKEIKSPNCVHILDYVRDKSCIHTQRIMLYGNGLSLLNYREVYKLSH